MVSPYHPFRFFETDPHLRQKLDYIRKRNAAPVAHVTDAEGRELVVVSSHVDETFLRQARDRTELMGLFWKNQETQDRLNRFLHFWDDSREVMAFDPALATALAHTDINDVPWDEIRLPFDHFYLSWGTALGVHYKIQDREYCVDGAYIQRSQGPSFIYPSGSLLLDFTSRRLSPPYTAGGVRGDGIIMADPIDSFTLAPAPGETIGAAIEKGMTVYESHCAHIDDGLPDSIEELAKEWKVGPRRPGPFTPSRDRFERGKERLIPALPLLFNCLFYLVQRPEDVREEFNQPVPKGAMDRLVNAPSEWSRERRRQRLADRGFHRIKLVANAAIQAVQGEATPTGKTVVTHLRRGHWARQPYGEGQKLRRYIWRMPVMVNAEAGEIATAVVHDVTAPKKTSNPSAPNDV